MSGTGENASQTINLIVVGGKATIKLSDNSEVVVKVCNGKALPMLLTFGAELARDLDLTLSNPESIKGRLLDRVDDVEFILQLISNKAKAVYGLLAVMSSLQTVERVEELSIEDLYDLSRAVIEVNRDFFTKRVLPTLLANAAKSDL